MKTKYVDEFQTEVRNEFWNNFIQLAKLVDKEKGLVKGDFLQMKHGGNIWVALIRSIKYEISANELIRIVTIDTHI